MKFFSTYITRNIDTFNFLGGILFVVCVFICGPKISKWYGEYYNAKVNKNGKMVKGKIVRFSYYKGDYIHVKYDYQSREYIVKEMESNDDNRYLIGQEVIVMLDTTDPIEAYVVEFN